MELNITELDNNFDETFDDSKFFEEIPENNVPIKRVVHFNEKPMIQQIPRENARMVRPKIINPRPQISYEDILSKMGMFVADGKLHLLDDKTPKQKQEFKQQMQTQNQPQNSYIYNKYFKDELQPQNTIRRPRTKEEYTRMLLLDILQKQRINQIKSKKLIMPTTNIHMAEQRPNNMNKLFHFSNPK
jgi:hypothetical protein